MKVDYILGMSGRPLEYGHHIIEGAKDYLAQCKDSFIVENGTPVNQVKLPSIEGLAVFLHVGRPTIYDWKEKFQEFSYIVEEILAEQADRLLNNGLSGRYNASITKLLLNKHGHSDKQETTISGNPDSPLVHRIERVIVKNA